MHGDHWWGMGWMWVFWIVILVGIVALVAWLVRAVQGGMPRSQADESPEEVLKKQLARGDIDRAEYEERLKALRR